MNKRLFFLFLAWLLPVVEVRPEEEISVEDLVRRDRVAEAMISPDGKKVAYVLISPDFEKNSNERDIHVADIAARGSIRLTTAKGSDSNPTWSPDGRRIAFASARSGTSQIWIISLEGGEARPLTELKVPARKPLWSPDGKHIAFLARRPPREELKSEFDDAKVMRDIENRAAFNHIWVVNPDGQKPRRITKKDLVYEDLCWSPDGTRLAFTFDEKGTRNVSEDSHVGWMSVEGGEIHRLTGNDIFAGAPAWSRDGKRIAYFRDRRSELGAYLNVKDLYVFDLDSNESRNLTEGEALAVGGYRSIPHTPPAWSHDDGHLYLLAADGPFQNLYSVPAEGGALTPVTEFEGEVTRPTFSEDRKTAAFVMGSFVQVPEVYASRLEPLEAKRLTRTMEPLEKIGFKKPERLRFISTDGTSVEGFLFRPDGITKGKRVPLIVDIHGGPASRWGAFIPRYTPWRVYLGMGMAVLAVNPRGSTAYGEKFRRGNFEGFGLGDLEDILCAVDQVIEMGVADPGRLGISGYSYGGFMANNLITRTTKFRAAVSIAGACNYISCYCQTNPVLPRVFYDGPPWGENRMLYLEHSPISRVDRVTTPTLIMHGEKDRAVHVSQSLEFFRALREGGVQCELVIYPREGHSISEPAHWRDYMQRSVDWFKKYLLE